MPTKQETFDTVVAHLRKQRRKAEDANGCCYAPVAIQADQSNSEHQSLNFPVGLEILAMNDSSRLRHRGDTTDMRTVTVTVPYLGYSLAFTVDYEWHGKYVRATRESPEEFPELEIHSAVLMEIDGEVPTPQDIRLHGDAALIDRVELEVAVIEADAREYPARDQDDAMNADTRI